jgi:hypothetical protein
MPEPSFQTVRLCQGRHESPEGGVCVVELASMIAGERFSDHPWSVSPVIAAFLRGYNDVCGERRQDLLRCAADAVGTRVGDPVERDRLGACLERFDRAAATAPLPWVERRLWRRSPRRLRRLVLREPVDPGALDEFTYALARMLHRQGDAGHECALALVDELVALGRAPDAPPARLTEQPSVG